MNKTSNKQHRKVLTIWFSPVCSSLASSCCTERQSFPPLSPSFRVQSLSLSKLLSDSHLLLSLCVQHRTSPTRTLRRMLLSLMLGYFTLYIWKEIQNQKGEEKECIKYCCLFIFVNLVAMLCVRDLLTSVYGNSSSASSQ